MCNDALVCTPDVVRAFVPDPQVVFFSELSWTVRGAFRSVSMNYSAYRPDLESLPWPWPVVDLRETPPEKRTRVDTVLTAMIAPEGVRGGVDRLTRLLERMGAKIIYPQGKGDNI